MKKYKNIVAALAITAICFGVKAQSVSPQVIASGGDYFGTSNYSLSWTLGETAISFFSMTNGSLSAGFQQSNDVVTGIEEFALTPTESLRLTPNPVKDILTISLSNANKKTTYLQLMDMHGRLLLQKNIVPNSFSTEMDVSQLPPAPYMIKCSTEDGSYNKTLKFIKH